MADYVKLDNKWCEPQIEETKNDWLSAKVACDNDRHCKMFYDVKSANKTFVLCGAFPITRTSEFLESTAYTKCNFAGLLAITVYDINETIIIDCIDFEYFYS